MKRILLGTVAAFALASTAFAADLPSRTAPPVAPIYAAPIFTWTGFYAGVNAGVSFNNNPTFIGGGNTNLDPGVSGTGFTGGGQLGYNWQTGAFVLGLETDINFRDNGAGVNGTRPTPAAFGAAFPTYTLSGFDSNDWFGTVRGRLGYTFDRVMIYATGGLAYGGNNGGTITLNSGGVGPNAVFSSSGSGSNVGWTVGGGIEYAITNNLSAKVEYLHVDLGGSSYAFTPPGGGVLKYTERNSDDVVRVGLNYKFGG